MSASEVKSMVIMLSTRIFEILRGISYLAVKEESNLQELFMKQAKNCIREVEIPAIVNIADLGNKNWRIDETICQNDEMFIPVELKFDGGTLKDRDFVKDALTDVEKIKYVVHQFKDVQMGAVVFVSDNKDELIEFGNRANHYFNDAQEITKKYGGRVIIITKENVIDIQDSIMINEDYYKPFVIEKLKHDVI